MEDCSFSFFFPRKKLPLSCLCLALDVVVAAEMSLTATRGGGGERLRVESLLPLRGGCDARNVKQGRSPARGGGYTGEAGMLIIWWHCLEKGA